MRPEPAAERQGEIDLLKIAACFAVIAIHVSAMGVASPDVQGAAQMAALAVNGAMYFAVPVFIFLSGTGLMLRYGQQTLNFRSYFRKRVSGIAIPYLGWSFTYYFIYAAAGYYALDLANVASVAFLGMGEYHLYFVVILFQLYVLFPFLKQLLERVGPLPFLGAVMALHLAFTAAPPALPYMDRIFVPYLIHFAVGMVVGAHYPRVVAYLQRHKWAVAACFFVALILYVRSRIVPPSLFVASLLWHGYSLTAAAAGFAGAKGLLEATAISRFQDSLKAWSGATFYVYLGHPLLIALFFKLWNDMGQRPGPGALLLAYAVVTVLSFWAAFRYAELKRRWKRVQ